MARWAKENNLYQDAPPPDAYDDLHTLANQPRLTINSPLPEATIRGQELLINITADAPRGIKRIRYYLDGALAAESELTNTYPLSLAVVPTGFHTVGVGVFDDIDNTKKEERLFNYIP